MTSHHPAQTQQRFPASDAPDASDERGGGCATSRPAAQIIDVAQPRRCTVRPASKRAQRGFTLIELMFSVTIVGFLSSVAFPAYQGTVQKVRRSDALIALMDLQMAQERFRTNNAAYGSLTDLRARDTSPAGHYQLDVQAPSDAGFVALATAAGSQRSDSACGVLKLTVDGGNVSYASGSDSHVGNDGAANKRCWSL